mmetsp:Transcript_25619/g.55364  ORF Transcript_25619/g.55364 Transcript_25619/m.55364 type:complete len:249 (-) Transcript_25619:38-784(-)
MGACRLRAVVWRVGWRGVPVLEPLRSRLVNLHDLVVSARLVNLHDLVVSARASRNLRPRSRHSARGGLAREGVVRIGLLSPPRRIFVFDLDVGQLDWLDPGRLDLRDRELRARDARGAGGGAGGGALRLGFARLGRSGRSEGELELSGGLALFAAGRRLDLLRPAPSAAAHAQPRDLDDLRLRTLELVVPVLLGQALRCLLVEASLREASATRLWCSVSPLPQEKDAMLGLLDEKNHLGWQIAHEAFE